MFEEAQLYSPVTTDADGNVVVQLGEDHPGANDPAYRARRNEIAAHAMAWEPGSPIPHIAYSDDEHEVWRIVCRELGPKHERYACRDFLEGAAKLALPCDHIPQLDEVTANLRPLTGFEYLPAAGLVPLKQFYSALGDRNFYSTQYIRHSAVPLYTPEPDLIHEVIGHGNLLAAPRFAEIKRQAGLAAQRVGCSASSRRRRAGVSSSNAANKPPTTSSSRPIESAQNSTGWYLVMSYSSVAISSRSSGRRSAVRNSSISP